MDQRRESKRVTKKLKFPSWKYVQWNNKTQTKNPNFVKLNFRTLLLGYFNGMGMRTQNHLQAEGKPVMTHEQLVEFFEHIVDKQDCSWLVSSYDHVTQGGNRLDVGGVLDEELDRMIENAAAFVINNWDSTWTARNRDAAANGGSASRRKPTYSPAILDSVQGLSISRQAWRLGISESTVSRLRAEKKYQNRGLTLEELQYDLG